MYTKRGITYADPYKMLLGAGIVAYQAHNDDYAEIDCPIDDMAVGNGFATWGNGNIVMALPFPLTYEAVKTKLVKIRYSNDDQIAILCNNDPAEVERMQRWRDWASDVATTIMSKI